MKIPLKYIFAAVMFVGVGFAHAQTVEIVYPASICDTENANDVNSLNPHITKGPTAIVGISSDSADETTVTCPIPRTKTRSRNRVRISIYLLREEIIHDISCLFRNTRRNGIPVSTIVDGHIAGSGPIGNIRLDGNFPSTVRNGTLGVSCTFADNSGIALYTIRVREF